MVIEVGAWLCGWWYRGHQRYFWLLEMLFDLGRIHRSIHLSKLMQLYLENYIPVIYPSIELIFIETLSKL